MISAAHLRSEFFKLGWAAFDHEQVVHGGGARELADGAQPVGSCTWGRRDNRLSDGVQRHDGQVHLAQPAADGAALPGVHPALRRELSPAPGATKAELQPSERVEPDGGALPGEPKARLRARYEGQRRSGGGAPVLQELPHHPVPVLPCRSARRAHDRDSCHAGRSPNGTGCCRERPGRTGTTPRRCWCRRRAGTERTGRDRSLRSDRGTRAGNSLRPVRGAPRRRRTAARSNQGPPPGPAADGRRPGRRCQPACFERCPPEGLRVQAASISDPMATPISHVVAVKPGCPALGAHRSPASG